MSGETGIIRNLLYKQTVAGEMPLDGYSALLEQIQMYFYEEMEHRMDEAVQSGERAEDPFEGRLGHRMSVREDRAIVKAVGEGLERYASSLYNPDELETARYPEVADRAIRPDELSHFTEDECRWLEEELGESFATYSDETTFRWKEGWSLRDDEPLLVPAPWVYIIYNFVDPGERLVPFTSTGWAVANTKEEAILTGLYEFIERDSMSIAWLNKLELPAVDKSTIQSEATHEFLDLLEERGIESHILQSTTDVGIPSYITIMVNRNLEEPAISMGAACHLDAEEAVLHAVEETMEVIIHLLDVYRRSPRFIEDPKNIESMMDHPFYWTDQKRFEKLDFWLDADEEVDLREVPDHSSDDLLENITTAVDMCTDAGLHPISVDATPRDLEQIDLKAMKTLVGGAQIHWYGYGKRALGLDRPFEAPVKAGYRDEPLDPDEMMMEPFPYA